ncbi:MAG: hypothetical protein KAT58_12075, partial [candidate division Zixibacteria bacterium]|nr:hypothetical protein [candidate division Zixibacteria bacterium]
LAVNWHNGKVLGAIIEGASNDAVGFFIGDVAGTGFNTSLFFGNDIVDLGPGPILAISGSNSFAQFYGNQFQGVGFDLSGSTHNVLTQATEESWLLTGAGFRTPSLSATTTGSVIWEGFVVGVGEDMNNPETNRRYFMNMGTADLFMSIDRDTGDISGSMNAADIGGSTAMISGLQIGGTNPSAYLTDRILAAGLGGGTPIAFSPNPNNPLKTYGNYFVTADPSKQLATYASWGSWEIAYVEPGSGLDYHVHVPSSMWVAGERTSPTNVSTLIATNFSATYTGGAAGVQIPTTGSMIDLTGGTTNLLLDFDGGATTPVSGTISFNEVTLNVTSTIGALTAPGFSASIPPAATSFVNGSFYGPNAESIAGNFYVDFGGSNRYMGVFGGDR